MSRFQPLDVFRGMTICLMIIVNTPGNYSTTFPMLLHADWHGFTPTDLVFPSFLFAVGNALAFVIPKWRTWKKRDVYLKLFRRSLVIFLLGYLMYWFPFMKWTNSGELIAFPLSETRVFGVLQRIALCYFFGVLLIRGLNKQQLVWASAVLLIGYWALMALFGDYEQNNFALQVDQWLLSDPHLYQGYGFPFDPEGLLSTLPSIVNVLAGYLAGVYVHQNINFEKLAKMLLIGTALMAVGYLWNPVFPINKSLWTSSFVLLTVGLDLILLAILIYVMQFSEKKITFGFFETFGKNPLFIYLLSEYLAITLYFVRVGNQSLFRVIYLKGFAWLPPKLGSLVFALAFMLICWAAARFLDRKKLYIRV